MLSDARKGVKPDLRGERAAYVACGVHAVSAFLRARPSDVRQVLATRERRAEIESLARAARLDVEPSDPPTLDKLSGGVPHQGVVALGRPPRPRSLKELLGERPDAVLILDGVTDPRNVGALLRTAEAMAVGAVVLANDRAPRLSPAMVKAAAGAVEWLSLVRVPNLARSLESLREAGYWVLALEADAEIDIGIPDAVPGLPVALVVGSEGRGVRPLLLRACHRLLRIPMPGRTPSLNVSVAAGIALYEIARLRTASARPP